MSVEHLARKHGLTVPAVRKRLEHGKPLDKPLQRRARRGKPVTISALAAFHGLTYDAAESRIKRGKPLDQPKRQYTKHGKTKKRVRFSPLDWKPDPLNLACNAWRTTTLAALGVRRNLKARI